MPNRWFLVGLLTPLLTFLLLFATAAYVIRPRPKAPLVHVRPPSTYTVHGIDVSHHQGDIEWERVAADGRIQFAWMKATQGAGHTDRRSARNWEGAQTAGIKVGAYHYYSMCRDGAEQAAHFIDTVPKVPGMLPPAVDVEEDERCNRRVPRNLKAELGAYLSAVEDHYGQRPILYVTSWYLGEHLGQPDADLWLAAYTRHPRPGFTFTFWQYTSRGRVPGITGPVDLDVFAGSASELTAHDSPLKGSLLSTREGD